MHGSAHCVQIRPLRPSLRRAGTECVLLEMYILPVLGSGADADNGMAHLVTFIHCVQILSVLELD
jgi:hypothetical protein